MAKKTDHRLFFEGVQKKYPQEFKNCKSFVLNYLKGKGTEEYILSQAVVSTLQIAGIPKDLANIYGEERFHQLLGMIIYDTITINLRDTDFRDWEYTKTELDERDYLQSIYFKAKR
ncbi:MAG: hypothetical protein K0S61_306 [Anaerocolumna sp.]|jgi:hypothetical protein|nr:hypothetical protein [Anaerocolumna sp.]